MIRNIGVARLVRFGKIAVEQFLREVEILLGLLWVR